MTGKFFRIRDKDTGGYWTRYNGKTLWSSAGHAKRSWELSFKSRGKFDDGDRCTNLQASLIIYDILIDEGRWWRARRWFLATFLAGGGECRKNGMFKLKD